MAEITLHTDSHRPETILLTPTNLPARSGPMHGRILSSPSEIREAIDSAFQSEIVAVDFETKGGDYSTDITIVGMGLAWDQGSCYIPYPLLYDFDETHINIFLASHRGLVAHNVYFDGGVTLSQFVIQPRWHACTYALLAMLHNESPESKWGLKDAMTNLLGWESSNETELDEWLVLSGYYLGNRRVDNSKEYLRAQFQAGGLRPNKGEMWRAPVEILGKYCVLDAEATYLLYTGVLRPVLQKFPTFAEFFYREWMHLIDVNIKQRIHGIEMDRPGLLARNKQISHEVEELTNRFLDHELTRPHILDMQEEMLVPLIEKEPARYTIKGVQSKNWEKWSTRLAAARQGLDQAYQFNVQSGPQMRELLYNRLGNEVRILSESGEASVSAKAFRHISGGIGSILSERMGLVKEQSYVQAYIELTSSRSTIHPSFRTPGTVTGRLSSKEPNLQQVSKTREVMSLFRSRPGHVWVDCDFASLEPTVTTEFSQDPNMMLIYGNTASPYQDFYLFIASSIPGIREQVLAAGYDPLNPTRDGVANAKKECKGLRSLCKTVALACAYGAGVNKVYATLEEQGMDISRYEVEKIHSGYWELFSGVKEFSRDLYFQWKRNRGYILNGLGRPMAIPEQYNKDILNRFTQSTGHDILVKYIYIITNLLDERRIQWKPIVIDWHDSTAVEVPEDQAELTVEIFQESMYQLNEQLQGTIELKGTPTVGRNMAEIKEAE